MRNLVGTAFGAAIDRRDGDSGVKGAIIGYVASGTLKTAAKLGLLAAIAAGGYRLVRKSDKPQAIY